MLNSSKLTSYEVKLPISLPFQSSFPEESMDLLRVLSIQLELLPSLRLWSRQQGQRNSKRNVGPTVSGCLAKSQDGNTLLVAEAWLTSSSLFSQPCHLAADQTSTCPVAGVRWRS
jgi:hypothetical protein